MKKLSAKTEMIVKGVIWIGIIQAVIPQRAYAYLDPGTGSYMLQVAFGLFIGALFSIKTFWKNIKTFVFKLLRRRGEN